MADKLRFDYINSLPPLIARFCGDKDIWWPIHDIEVSSALCRIDVCGRLQVKSFAEIAELKDENGTNYDPEKFWCDFKLEATHD